MLRKETYSGVWHYGKTRTDHKGGVRIQELDPRTKWVEIEVPEIITKDAWEEVQLILDANLRTHSGHIKHEYLLRGRALCTECNIRYYNQTIEQKYGYYIHDEYKRHITECTNKKRISASVSNLESGPNSGGRSTIAVR